MTATDKYRCPIPLSQVDSLGHQVPPKQEVRTVVSVRVLSINSSSNSGCFFKGFRLANALNYLQETA
jgi:hypothetical protein